MTGDERQREISLATGRLMLSLYRKDLGGDQKEIPEYHHTFICNPQ